MSDTPLDAKRHSLAHLLAAAVLELYPDAKITLGPAIDTGFYYDVALSSPLGDKDLPKIQKRMKKLLPTWDGFSSETVSVNEARERFAGNPFKLELIDEIAERGEDITLYTSGAFTDLCRGGHVNSMRDIAENSWKLDRIAGAYWRGDETKPMLTRIYGVAFDTPEELDAFETMRTEAEKRDHRKLGKELDLFTFSDLVGPGLPLFTPKGTLLRDLIIEKIQGIQKNLGYERVTIPHITKKELYETSGHWEKFQDDLFHVTGKSEQAFVMKPMNCPHHTQIYASRPHSYRDLPVRYMESTMVYRDEQAGELIGLSRVRSITQDDGHVFCTPEQIEQEVSSIVHVIREFYTSLGMWNDNTYWVSLSVRDPKSLNKYLGDDASWDMAEKALESVAKKEGLNYKRVEGEAAFYGPKLDFMFHDALGRERQLATAQVDFNMPKRFELEYTDQSGEKKTPVMIHRAIAGSLERFLAVIIEHFAGHFPLWLSPVQVAVLPISGEHHESYTSNVVQELQKRGVRVEHMNANESLGKRIRIAKKSKVPYLIICGDEEKKNTTITVEGRDDETMKGITLEAFIAKLEEEIR